MFRSILTGTMFVSLATLSACQQDRMPDDPPAAQMRQEKAECEAKGGSYERAGMFGHACILQTKDAGKSCNRESDCEGICLAKTRTCSAITPMFGCFSMLDDAGKTVELCID